MADVNLTLGVDTDEAEKEIKDFAREGSTALKGIQSSFNALGVAAGAAVAFFAGKGIVSGISQVVEAANIQGAAVNSLNTSLRLAGDFSEAASQDIQDFASGLQQVTTVGDETTLGLFALAKNFGLTNDQTKDLTKAAIELSAATGISLESAVTNLGKSTGGLVGELGESIPALKGLSKEALESGAAIQFVLDRFGGAAASKVNSFAGATAQLSNIFGDLQEEIGFVITKNPQLIAAINEISRIITELTGTVTDSREGFSDAFGTAIEITASLATKTAIAFAAIGGVLNDAKLGYRILAEAIVRSLNAPFVAFKRFDAFINETFASIIQNAGEFVGKLISALKLIPGAESFFPEIDAAAGKLVAFTNSISDGLEQIAEDARNTRPPLADLEDAATRATAEQILANKEFEASSQKIINSIAAAETRITAAGDAAIDFGQKVETSTNQAAAGVENVGKKATETAKKQQESFDKLIKAIETTERKAQPLEDQLTELGVAFSDAFAAGDFDEANRLFKEIETTAKSITTETEKQAEAQRKLAEETAQRLEAEQKAAQEQTDKLTQTVLGSFAGGGGGGESQLNVESLESDIENLKETLNSAGLTEETRIKLQQDLIKKEEELAKAQKSNLENSRKLVSGVASVVGDIFLPGFGGIIGQLTDTLSQGPEAAAAFITGLVEGIPTIIENILLALPDIILALSESMPEVAARLAIELPAKVIPAIIKRLPELIQAQISQAPRIAFSIAEAIGKQIFGLDFDLTDFGNELLSKAANFGQAIIDSASGFIQKLIDEIKGAFDIFGGDSGGGGGGGGGGTFERVVVGVSTGGLSEVARRAGLGLTSQGSGFGPTNSDQFERIQEQRENELVILAGLQQAISLLAQQSNRTLNIELNVAEQNLANVLLRLNQAGFRVA